MLSAYLTAEAAEYVDTVFDALGKPKPAAEGDGDAGHGAHDAHEP